MLARSLGPHLQQINVCVLYTQWLHCHIPPHSFTTHVRVGSSKEQKIDDKGNVRTRKHTKVT